ncbi:hypothetical protein MKX03_007122 [Papaver bracteatum]|nr:hypothetical protein MKX03_007122 [Papaver bracteatum]
MSNHNSNPASQPDAPGFKLAQFGAGCSWGVELAFQRVEGVVKTEVGYSQGHIPDPTYKLVCTGTTNHFEVGGDVGTQYKSGIYYYDGNQEKLARELMEIKQNEMKNHKIVTEILPATKFYRDEEYHQ